MFLILFGIYCIIGSFLASGSTGGGSPVRASSSPRDSCWLFGVRATASTELFNNSVTEYRSKYDNEHGTYTSKVEKDAQYLCTSTSSKRLEMKSM